MIKTPKDPEDLVLVIKNMDTDVIVEEYHLIKVTTVISSTLISLQQAAIGLSS